jgi:hypothetical protein
MKSVRIFEAGCRGRRRASIARALAAFNPTLPRVGRVQRRAKRCLIAYNGLATMTQLDLEYAILHVRRVKQGTQVTHPLTGRELRALRRLQREPEI